MLGEHYSWYASNSVGRSYSVEALLPNDTGLFDMHGNAWEWIQNLVSGQFSPVDSRLSRVYSGGSFVDPSAILFSDNYNSGLPAFGNVNIGFRVARSLPLDPAACPSHDLKCD